MSYSYTATETRSFTITHARDMAAKVATDLRRLQRLYGKPSDASIENYEAEVIALLKAGYLDTVSYGFRRNGKHIEPTLFYTAQDLFKDAVNDDPGRIRPNADISGATFYSYLTYSKAWDNLTSTERSAFKESLPIHRSNADEPGVDGYVQPDRTYSSGGKCLNRKSVRSFG